METSSLIHVKGTGITRTPHPPPLAALPEGSGSVELLLWWWWQQLLSPLCCAVTMASKHPHGPVTPVLPTHITSFPLF